MVVSWGHKGDNSATLITNPIEIKCHSFIHSPAIKVFFSRKIKRESRRTGKEQKKKKKEEEEEEEEERLIAGSRISRTGV